MFRFSALLSNTIECEQAGHGTAVPFRILRMMFFEGLGAFTAHDLDPRCHCYLSWVEIEENEVLSLVPSPLTTAMMATEIPAAIRPYSIAVASDSSFKKARSLFILGAFQIGLKFL